MEQVATKRGLKFALEQSESLPPVEMDLHVCAALERSAEKVGVGKLESAVSGALRLPSFLLRERTPQQNAWLIIGFHSINTSFWRSCR